MIFNKSKENNDKNKKIEQNSSLNDANQKNQTIKIKETKQKLTKTENKCEQERPKTKYYIDTYCSLVKRNQRNLISLKQLLQIPRDTRKKQQLQNGDNVAIKEVQVFPNKYKGKHDFQDQQNVYLNQQLNYAKQEKVYHHKTNQKDFIFDQLIQTNQIKKITQHHKKESAALENKIKNEGQNKQLSIYNKKKVNPTQIIANKIPTSEKQQNPSKVGEMFKNTPKVLQKMVKDVNFWWTGKLDFEKWCTLCGKQKSYFQSLKQTSCHHSFHTTCFHLWINSDKKTCPDCNCKLSLQN